MNKKTLPVLAALCTAALAIMTAVLVYTGQPRFTPPPFDPAAQSGTPDVPEGLGYGELDATAFRFSAAGVLTADNGPSFAMAKEGYYVFLKANSGGYYYHPTTPETTPSAATTGDAGISAYIVCAAVSAAGIVRIGRKRK